MSGASEARVPKGHASKSSLVSRRPVGLSRILIFRRPDFRPTPSQSGPRWLKVVRGERPKVAHGRCSRQKGSCARKHSSAFYEAHVPKRCRDGFSYCMPFLPRGRPDRRVICRVGTLASVALVRTPTFYPGGDLFRCTGLRPSIPLAAGAAFRRWGPSERRRISAPDRSRSLATRSSPAASARTGMMRSRDQASLAPVGTRPVSENRHSAISSLRASATIITRRIRPRAPPVRSSIHLAKRAVRLMAQPAPRHLDEERTDPGRTVAADALVPLCVPACPRGRRQPGPARKLTAVAEVAVEDLLLEQHRVVRADPLQLGQRRNLGRCSIRASLRRE